MVWLATQMWGLLALSLLLGLLAGRWIWRHPQSRVNDEADKELAQLRSRIEESDAEKAKLRSQLLEYETEQPQSSSNQASTDQVSTEVDPILYESASDGNADDLKLIKGIGPQLEKMLNDMGIYYYHQIAAWTDNQAAKIDDRLRFKGRIMRDNWRAQASALSSNR
jgi:predicted flap endonuclease-1-like 5' DNA nuclease